MKSVLPVSLCLLSLVGIVRGQPGTPKGPPPTLIVVESTTPEKAVIVFRQSVEVYVPVEVVETIVKNGEKVQVRKTVIKTEHREELVTHDAANYRVITPDGKQLPIEEVWKRVKANTVVAVSGDGNTPAEAYLRALSAETLVIIPPAARPIEAPPKKKT